jgi:hypothetical protein
VTATQQPSHSNRHNIQQRRKALTVAPPTCQARLHTTLSNHRVILGPPRHPHILAQLESSASRVVALQGFNPTLWFARVLGCLCQSYTVTASLQLLQVVEINVDDIYPMASQHQDAPVLLLPISLSCQKALKCSTTLPTLPPQCAWCNSDSIANKGSSWRWP